MGFAFRVQKTVQVVAHLLKLSPDQRMDTIVVLKMLYLADRESLSSGRNPIVGDKHVAMKFGPVLSRTYDLSKTPDDWSFGSDEEECWLEHFSKDGHTLCLKNDPGTDDLSPYEMAIIKKVYDEFKAFGTWELVEYMHKLPEWIKNHVEGTSESIPLRDILEAVGRSDDAEEILQAKKEEKYFAKLFG